MDHLLLDRSDPGEMGLRGQPLELLQLPGHQKPACWSQTPSPVALARLRWQSGCHDWSPAAQPTQSAPKATQHISLVGVWPDLS